eukprot:TRINITY_DN2112_c0_g1_i1.p1 TRINITY_DN2112_c0_g1~~TRINITY_DN2112_c0_g1_i1.p1  ORF type:complete len:282 (-),score=26.04 TRINITY_DN2112_c0_g1_i1:12-857(-)
MESNSANIASASTTTANPRKRRLEDFRLNINFLPSEIIVHIFSFLKVERPKDHDYWNQLSQLICLSLVCKQWNVLSQEPSLWEHYLMELEESKFPEQIKKLVDPKFSRISSLFFVGIGHSSLPPHYAHLVLGGYQGCSECLSVFNKLSEGERFNLTQITKSVTMLGLTKYKIDEDVFRGICSLKLNEMDIRSSVFDPNISFKSITQLTALKYMRVDFSQSPNITNNSIFLYLSGLPNLTRLDIIGLPPNENENISYLSKLFFLHYYHYYCYLSFFPDLFST